MAEFVPVAGVDEIAEGEAHAYLLGEEEIAVVRCEDEFYAVTNICTHAHAYLSDGEVDIDDCTIECPLHGARFALRTGRVRALPATEPIKTYPVQIVDGQICVAVNA